MPDVAKLSTRFRITIPKAVREARGWKPGQRFALIPRGKGVLMVPEADPADIAGIAKGADAGAYRDRRDRF